MTVLTRSLVHRRAEHQSGSSGEAALKPATQAEIADNFTLVAKFLLASTQASGVSIAILDETGLHCRASAGEAPQPGSAIRMDNTISGQCIRSGVSFSCDDTLEKCPNALPARSILLLPIVWGRNARGLVALFSRQPKAFSDATGAVARSAAAMLAIALNAWCPQLDAPIDGNVLEADLADPFEQLGPPPARLRAAAPANAVAPVSTPKESSPKAVGEDGRLAPRKKLCGLPCAQCGSYSSVEDNVCPVCKSAK